MLYAVLDCSDTRCRVPYEAWAEPAELDALDCEECGAPLEIVAWANADRAGVAPRAAELRRAA